MCFDSKIPWGVEYVLNRHYLSEMVVRWRADKDEW